MTGARQTVGEGDTRPRTPHLPWLAAIVGLALALRLLRLGEQPLWLDEVMELQTALHIDQAGFGSIIKDENVAPLSHWVLWALLKIFGVSAGCVRAPAVVASTLAVFLTWHLGKSLFSSKVGSIAALIMAVSPFAIWHGQDGRMYAMLMCFSAAIMLLFWRCISPGARRLDWLLLCTVTAASLYTHQYTVLLSVACGLFLLLREGLRSPLVPRFILNQFVAGLCFLPWFIHSLVRLSEPAGMAKGSPLLWAPYTVFTFLFGYSFGPSVDDLHWGASALRPYLAVLAAIALPVAYLLAVSLKRLFAHSAGAQRSGLYVLTSLVVPVALALVPPLISQISYNVRYTVVAFPAFAILLAVGIDACSESRWRLLAIAPVGCALLWSLINWYTNPHYSKADTRSAAQFLRGRYRSGDTVIFSSSMARIPFAFYGFPPPAEHTELVTKASLEAVVAKMEAQTPTQSGRVWLIEARRWESDPENKLRRALERSAAPETSWSWPGVEIRLYRGANSG